MDILAFFRAKSSAKQLIKHGFVLTLSILLSSLGLVLLHGFLHGNEGRSFAFAVLSDAQGAYMRLVRGSDLEINQSIARIYQSDHQQPGFSHPGLAPNFAASEAAESGQQATRSPQVVRNISVFQEDIAVEPEAPEPLQQRTNTAEIVHTASVFEGAIPLAASNASALDVAVSSIASNDSALVDAIPLVATNDSAFEDAIPSIAGENLVSEEVIPSVAGEVSTKRTLFVVSTHYLDPHIEGEFEHMVADVGEENAILLFDESRAPYSGRWQKTFRLGAGPFAYRTADLTGPGPLVLLTSSDELRQGSKLFTDGWVTAHGKLVVLYRSVLISTRFEHVWIFESDVRCGGSYKRCVEKTAGLDHDLLGNELMVGGEETRFWPHWDELEGPVELEKRVKLFLPAMRLSRFAFEILSAADYDGMLRGYQEVYIPTVLSTYGASCGEFPDNMYGVYQFRPRLSISEYTNLKEARKADPDVLYHPVVDE